MYSFFFFLLLVMTFKLLSLHPQKGTPCLVAGFAYDLHENVWLRFVPGSLLGRELPAALRPGLFSEMGPRPHPCPHPCPCWGWLVRLPPPPSPVSGQLGVGGPVGKQGFVLGFFVLFL